MTLHLSGLRDKVTRELRVHNPVDRVEAEHLACDKRTLEFVDEMVVPGEIGACAAAAMFCLPGRFGGIHVAVDDHNPESLEGISDDGALRGADDVEFAAEQDGRGSNNEHAQTEQVGGPVTHEFFHVWRCQQRQRADIDATVENHVDPLDCQGRVNNDSFALFGADGHFLALVLVRNLYS